MPYKNLSTETMIAISSEWIDEKRLRPQLLAISYAAPYLPRLDTVHAELLATMRGEAQTEIDRQLEAVIAEERAVDTVHDRKLRGSFYVLTGEAELTDVAGADKAFTDLRDLLFPKGLKTTMMSYRDEAGQAEAAVERIDATTRTSLKKIKTVEGRTLDDEVSAWTAAGRQLGVLESKRALLEKQRDGAASPKGDAVRARNAWIRLTTALTSGLDLAASEGHGDAVDSLLTTLRSAEEKADARAASTRKSTNPPAPTPTPTPTK